MPLPNRFRMLGRSSALFATLCSHKPGARTMTTFVTIGLFRMNAHRGLDPVGVSTHVTSSETSLTLKVFAISGFNVTLGCVPVYTLDNGSGLEDNDFEMPTSFAIAPSSDSDSACSLPGLSSSTPPSSSSSCPRFITQTQLDRHRRGFQSNEHPRCRRLNH